MAVTFHNKDTEFRLPGKGKLKVWIRKVLKEEQRREGEINIVFTTDEILHEMNVRYLAHDTLTDIITFDQGTGNTISGDLVISIDRVRENAMKYEVHWEEELRRVMIHGILHLCGYGDKTAAEKETMRKKEDKALGVFPKS